MSIEIRQEEQGEVRILALSGRLDTETAADLELALQDLQALGATQFVIDLGEIGYVSSAGLRVLLALAKQLDGGRGSLKLCALNEAVKQVFDVAGFSKLFAIFPDRAAALAAMAPAGRPATAAPAPAPEPSLAQRAAMLLGAGEPGGVVDPESAALADSAARLLGAEKTARSGGEPAKPKAVAKAMIKPAAPPAATADPVPAAPGVLGKFRNLFGSKK
jgi:anti-sigma B factor antagonist